jgi:hypothetical protein
MMQLPKAQRKGDEIHNIQRLRLPSSLAESVIHPIVPPLFLCVKNLLISVVKNFSNHRRTRRSYFEIIMQLTKAQRKGDEIYNIQRLRLPSSLAELVTHPILHPPFLCVKNLLISVVKKRNAKRFIERSSRW